MDRAAAKQQYLEAIKLAPGNAAFHSAYALHLHSYIPLPVDQIESQYSRAIELDPSNAEYHDQLGFFLSFLKLPLVKDPAARQSIVDQAEAEYKRAIETSPGESGVYMDYCMFLSEVKGDIDAGEVYVKNHVELGKDYGGTYLNYALSPRGITHGTSSFLTISLIICARAISFLFISCARDFT
nr:hypothetical protein [Candidatus Sigynarchaeota archaeon]